MSDIETYRDHCRTMATAQHTPACMAPPASMPWLKPKPDPKCTGCVTDAERQLWTRLADEADEYLSRHEEGALW